MLQMHRTVAAPNHYTQILIDHLEKSDFSGKSVLDVGCGSGVLAIIAAKYLHATAVVAIDINQDAVDLTRQNVRANGCRDDAVRILNEDINTIKNCGPFDVILANLPQIPTPSVDRDVTCSGGVTGRDLIASTISQTPALQRPGGELYLVIADFVNENAVTELGLSLGLTSRVECERIARPGQYTLSFRRYIEQTGYRFQEDSKGPHFALKLLCFRRPNSDGS